MVMMQLVGLVFDTTSSNSGKDIGACKLLEVWIGRPILWLACRRHIVKLHLCSAAKNVMGVSNDLGMAMFRRLRDTWHNLKINYSITAAASPPGSRTRPSWCCPGRCTKL